MIRNLFRHFGESLKSLRRNGWMTLASVSAVTVTLILVGIFFAVIFNVTKLAQDIENNVKTSVYVEIGSTDEEIKQVGEDLKQLKYVEAVKFSSKEEQLDLLKDSLGSVWDTISGDSNPLADIYIVSASKPEYTKNVQKQAEKLKNVERADYGGISSDRIFALSSKVRTWGLGAALLLLFVAVFLISNTIRITILSRRREIEIMRLVGAKNSFIRGPFFFEGACIGILGSIIPIVVVTIVYKMFYDQAMPKLIPAGYSLLSTNEFLFKVNGLMLIVGVVIGSLGSIVSMRKFLKI